MNVFHADALHRLFEPFYRVPGSREGNANGSGLGLAIAQRVATLHGGTIAARNREEGGLEVDIGLPAFPQPPQRAEGLSNRLVWTLLRG